MTGYDLLIDTPENRKIAETLRRYNNIKDTNGEPNYLWKVPHISGQRNSLKGGSCCSECKMTGGAMPNSILEQMDERQTLQRPRGMVSPYTQPPAKYIISGTSASYPQFNSVELDALENRKLKGGNVAKLARLKNPPTPFDIERNKQIDSWLEHERNLGKRIPSLREQAQMPSVEKVLEGSGALGIGMLTSGLKTGAKYGAKYGAQAVKTGIAGAKQGAKIAVMVAKNPAVQAVVSEIAKDPEVQKAVVGQITTLIKGKAAENVVEDAKDEELEGGRIKKGKSPKGKTDGRSKRAEIVKKVMKEHGLKMIEASSYVKKHNLY